MTHGGNLKLTVSNFSVSFTIQNAIFLIVDSNSSISVKIQNQTHIRMNVFLKMTYTITSKIIDLSS